MDKWVSFWYFLFCHREKWERKGNFTLCNHFIVGRRGTLQDRFVNERENQKGSLPSSCHLCLSSLHLHKIPIRDLQLLGEGSQSYICLHSNPENTLAEGPGQELHPPGLKRVLVFYNISVSRGAALCPWDDECALQKLLWEDSLKAWENRLLNHSLMASPLPSSRRHPYMLGTV